MDLEIMTYAAIMAVKKMLETLKAHEGADPRQVAIARTQFETAFLWTANAAGGESIFDG